MTINRSGKDDNYNGIYKTMDDSIATVQKIECKDRKEAQILIDELIDLMEMLKNKSLELQGELDLSNYSKLIMADIKDVEPNPLNPRMDNTIKTDELQRVIKEKGWEVPITCYERDNKYVILSGHRRWHAAKKLMQRKFQCI